MRYLIIACFALTACGASFEAQRGRVVNRYDDGRNPPVVQETLMEGNARTLSAGIPMGGGVAYGYAGGYGAYGGFGPYGGYGAYGRVFVSSPIEQNTYVIDLPDRRPTFIGASEPAASQATEPAAPAADDRLEKRVASTEADLAKVKHNTQVLRKAVAIEAGHHLLDCREFVKNTQAVKDEDQRKMRLASCHAQFSKSELGEDAEEGEIP